MQSPPTTRSDRFSVAPTPLQFGRLHGSLAAFHEPCYEHFIADAAWCASTSPATPEHAIQVASSN